MPPATPRESWQHHSLVESVHAPGPATRQPPAMPDSRQPDPGRSALAPAMRDDASIALDELCVGFCLRKRLCQRRMTRATHRPAGTTRQRSGPRFSVAQPMLAKRTLDRDQVFLP